MTLTVNPNPVLARPTLRTLIELDLDGYDSFGRYVQLVGPIRVVFT